MAYIQILNYLLLIYDYDYVILIIVDKMLIIINTINVVNYRKQISKKILNELGLGNSLFLHQTEYNIINII